ncbi:MAG: helix-turn-helix transcriptional regulator [Desulfuromonadaceae bacterium]|nr:helix-turn-helix transcriptional regulator [Desulfuromonadaceae bacterium]
MTSPDLHNLLRQRVDATSQAHVAREIGYSSATISQILSGKYGGDSSLVMARVEEVYGATTVQCPVLGEIPLKKCASHSRREFAATNPLRVSLHRACRTCPHNRNRRPV